MAEGDCFSEVMTKGFKGAYHLARKGHPADQVARTACKGWAWSLRAENVDLSICAKALKCVIEALQKVHERRGGLFEPAHNMRSLLNSQLSEILLASPMSEYDRLTVEVTKSIFEIFQARESFDPAAVSHYMGHQFALHLVESRIFAISAKGSMARVKVCGQTGRTMADQRVFEAQVATHMVPHIAAVISSIARNNGNIPKRFPRFPKVQDQFQVTEVHAALP